jgi:hypothetical protein
MKIIRDKITLIELNELAGKSFGQLVKAVVDIEKEIMVVDAELHADQEALLLEEGSEQSNLWGINLYPQEEGEKFIEFDSMINLRPSQGNRSRGVEDPEIRRSIIVLVNKLVEK